MARQTKDMNPEHESRIRALVQLSANMLMQMAANGLADEQVRAAGEVIDAVSDIVDPPPPPPDNVIPFPVKRK